MTQDIAGIRKNYAQRSLSESDTNLNPLHLFDRWWKEAVNAELDEVNAMTLATASADGVPSARIVLLKGYSEEGFTFSPITIAIKAGNCWRIRKPAWSFSGKNSSARCASRA